jgi:hypothetical protein
MCADRPGKVLRLVSFRIWPRQCRPAKQCSTWCRTHLAKDRVLSYGGANALRVLRLGEDATGADVKAAFRRLAPAPVTHRELQCRGVWVPDGDPGPMRRGGSWLEGCRFTAGKRMFGDARAGYSMLDEGR